MAIDERIGMPEYPTPSPHADDLSERFRRTETLFTANSKEFDLRLAAFQRPEKPIQSLSPAEQSIANNAVEHVHNLVKARSGPYASPEDIFAGKDPVGQAQLDLSHDLSGLAHEDLERILPSINAALEPSGLRLAEVPENKELYIGDLGQNGNWVPLAFATGLIGDRFK